MRFIHSICLCDLTKQKSYSKSIKQTDHLKFTSTGVMPTLEMLFLTFHSSCSDFFFVVFGWHCASWSHHDWTHNTFFDLFLSKIILCSRMRAALRVFSFEQLGSRLNSTWKYRFFCSFHVMVERIRYRISP